ncbi:MAG: hypothetical protein WBM50_21650 [Acidimicrobiales bacterium]
MPLPDESEQAARRVARIGVELDQIIVDHLLRGRPMPRPSLFLERVRDDITAAVTAAILDIDPDAPQTVLDAAVADAIDEAAVLYQRARRDAQTRRRRIVAADPEPEDDPGTLAGLARVARRVGFATAIAAALQKRRRIPRERIRQAAAASDDPIPPRLAAILKASVRTKAAELRNRHAADVADERGLVLFIRDALIGQDPPCVQVDRKYATPLWLRRHPTEHPNCTREGRPVSLPPGERVTLLR